MAFDVGARTREFVHETAGKLEQGQLQNDISAVRSFLARLLKDGRRLRVIMEATGIYFLDLALVAHELGAEVVVINPKRDITSPRGWGCAARPMRSMPGCCSSSAPHAAHALGAAGPGMPAIAPDRALSGAAHRREHGR
ncbi:MAG: hypothetical protein IPF57_17710, partial [Gammaproteobacteria bacterium]|nr:hypothetical protein [Gammaproteobacteria bacterium]